MCCFVDVCYEQTVKVLAWGLQYTLLSAITKLPTVKSRLQTEHLMHCLWSTLLSNLHFSIWYTLVPHTAHLSIGACTVGLSWLCGLRSGPFFSSVLLNVLLKGRGFAEVNLGDSLCGLVGTLGFSLIWETGLSSLELSLVLAAKVGGDGAPFTTFKNVRN